MVIGALNEIVGYFTCLPNICNAALCVCWLSRMLTSEIYKVLGAALEQVLNLGASPQLMNANHTPQHSYMEVIINNFLLHYYAFRCIELVVPPFWVRPLSDHIKLTECSI
jgi:hypothetical protein